LSLRNPVKRGTRDQGLHNTTESKIRLTAGESAEGEIC